MRLALEQGAQLIDASTPKERYGMPIGSQHAQQLGKDTATEQKALAPPLIGAAQVIEPGRLANLLADSDRRAVLQYVREPRRIRLVARRAVHRAAMMKDHGACGNRAYRRSLRIEARIAFDGVGFLGAAIQTVRKHAQQMRTRDVGHGAILDRAIRHRDPNADFIVFETRFAECFILMPRRGPALVHWFEDRVISGEAGLRTQQLPRYSERGFPIRQFAQFGCVQGGLQHARQRRVFAAVARNQIEISALAAALTAVEHAHQDFAAPLELGFRNEGCLDDEKSLPKKFGDLISRKE